MILGQWGTLGVFGSEAPPLVSFTVSDSTNIVYRESGRDLYYGKLNVGGVNTFTLTLDEWLNGEDFDNVEVSAPDLTINGGAAYDDSQNAIGVSLTGIDKGRYPVHFSWSTSGGRGGCMTGYIDVLEC